MFPPQNDNDLPFGADGGPFAGGFGGPPADGIFESLGDGMDPFEGFEERPGKECRDTPADDHFLTVGLHFFERIKGMR